MGTIFLVLLRASKRSEGSEHTFVFSSRFLCIYIYSVNKILRKIRTTTFTEKLRKITREGGGGGGGGPEMSNASN